MRQKITLYGVRILILVGVIVLSGCNRTPGNAPQKNPPLATTFVVNDPLLPQPIVNVYIENSGSMDGYVKGVTDFKHAIYSYLSDLRISDIGEEINLFYINSKVIPFGNDISDFIEKLNPNTFRVRGGNRGTSDISDVLKTILSETTPETVSIMVSDCIFSPGRGRDAEQYLINQQIGIKKKSVADYLKVQPDAAIVIYQLSSQFDGYYYNREDSKTAINERRPFYLWIIGNKQYISDFFATVPNSRFKGSGVENMFTIMQGGQKVNYAIRPGTGKFKLDKKNPKTGITKLKKKHNGEATFAVDVDFSAFMLDNEYLKNENHYLLTDKDYRLEVKNSPANSHGYTHSLNLSTDKIKPSHLSIKLKTQLPEWVEQMNDPIGMDIHEEGAMGKTYGIKYLVDGVYEAFTHHDEYYTEIKLSINNR